MARRTERGEEPVAIRVERTRGARGGSDGGSRKWREHTTSPWEWLVAALGAVLVVSALGYLLYDEYSGPSTPPLLEVSVDTVFPAGDAFVVEVEVRNRGSETAAAVVVEAVQRSGPGEPERAEVTLDFVPSGSRRRAGFLFTRDPRLHPLVVRVKGWDRP